MLRIIRLMDAAALSAVALWVAACSDSAAPTAPTAQFRTELVTCEASVQIVTTFGQALEQLQQIVQPVILNAKSSAPRPTSSSPPRRP